MTNQNVYCIIRSRVNMLYTDILTSRYNSTLQAGRSLLPETSRINKDLELHEYKQEQGEVFFQGVKFHSTETLIATSAGYLDSQRGSLCALYTDYLKQFFHICRIININGRDQIDLNWLN